MITGERHRLLVVENDPEIRYLLSVILDEPDREVVAVSTGDEARELLVAGDVDLVVLDLILPDIDGRTLLATMRERPETATVPVVVITARGGPEIRQDCYDLGADAFAEKPFDPDEVAADIAVRLERTASREGSAFEDSITGLLNRAGLRDAVPGGDTAYAMTLVQLDGFLTLSERWGWEEAESILRVVAGALGSAVAGKGPVARIGGGEFSYLLPETSLEDPAQLAQMVLERIRALPIRDPDGETLRLTASIGVAAVEPGTPLPEASEATRRRLFRAREGGGNQVVAEEDDGVELAQTRVLVAEDDEISATILVHRLQKEGLEIVRYDNGKLAYEAALEETPNLVILDVKMPGMDGFEVLERLRRTPAYSKVPIIMLTSMGSEADVVRGFQLGADDYILKPFSPVELSARVWRLLRRGRSASAL